MTEDRYQEERSLDPRIEQLEGELRRLRRYLLAGVVAISGVGLVALGPINDGAQEFETIRAERIDLVEADGTRRMVLSNEDGDAAIVLSDSDGNPRLRLFVDAEGRTGIEMLDPDGEVVSRLGPGDGA